MVLQKINFLNVIKKFEWVDGGPGQPGPLRLSKAATSLLLSSLVRDCSAAVSDQLIGRELRAIGKEMAGSAAAGLVEGWEDGDDLCPPWHKPPKWPPGPGPWPWLEALHVFDPTPEPWLEASPRLKDGIVGFALQQIASLTPDEQLAGQVNDVAMKLQG